MPIKPMSLGGGGRVTSVYQKLQAAWNSWNWWDVTIPPVNNGGKRSYRNPLVEVTGTEVGRMRFSGGKELILLRLDDGKLVWAWDEQPQLLTPYDLRRSNERPEGLAPLVGIK